MKYLLFLSIFLANIPSHAQDLKRGESYFKEGINFEHKPTHFKSQFRFRMQNRFTYETEDTEALAPEMVDFTVRRLRLRLDGTVWDPRFLYRIQLAFTRGDMDFDRTQYPNILRDAVVGWQLTKKTAIWYGQTKLPGNRQRIVSSGSQQFVDRSILNATFNIDRDVGLQANHWTGEEQPFGIKLALTNGEGRGTDNKNDGLSYTTRMEWLPLGPFKEKGDFSEGDLARELTPKLALGAAYNVNKKTSRPGGQLGMQYKTPDLHRDLETSFADVLFKYQGFSFYGEYARRWTYRPVFLDATKNVTIFKGHGFNTQAGYLFANNFETALRFTELVADKETLSGLASDEKQYTLALSKYINKHTVKAQTDLSYDEKMNSVTKSYHSSWIFRLQLEIGI